MAAVIYTAVRTAVDWAVLTQGFIKAGKNVFGRNLTRSIDLSRSRDGCIPPKCRMLDAPTLPDLTH